MGRGVGLGGRVRVDVNKELKFWENSQKKFGGEGVGWVGGQVGGGGGVGLVGGQGGSF